LVYRAQADWQYQKQQQLHHVEFHGQKKRIIAKLIEEKVAGKSWFTRAKDEDHCQSTGES